MMGDANIVFESSQVPFQRGVVGLALLGHQDSVISVGSALLVSISRRTVVGKISEREIRICVCSKTGSVMKLRLFICSEEYKSWASSAGKLTPAHNKNTHERS
jgi:hypothetical protein